MSGRPWPPLEYLEPDPRRGDETTVSLLQLTRRFDLKEVEHRLVEGAPLKAPSFQVVLNGERIQRALARNPELSPFGPLPEAGPGGQRGAAARGVGKAQSPEEIVGGPQAPPKRRRAKKPKVKRLTLDAGARQKDCLTPSCWADNGIPVDSRASIR